MTAPAVACKNLLHVYDADGASVVALRGVDLRIAAGETVALLGPSGSGKSTLLWQVAGLLRPTAGVVEIHGTDLSSLTPPAVAAFRAREIGIMVQNGGRNLLSALTATDNVLFAQRPIDRTARQKSARAAEVLESVGLTRVARDRAGRLSGGEQQRLALAVALANSPRLLVADEPTSQLDAATADTVIDLLRDINREHGTTVVVVTHDPRVSERFDRAITIRDGRVGAEAVDGVDLVVVGEDGAVHLPREYFDVLPPGSLARAVRTDGGVHLERIDGAGHARHTDGGQT